MPESRGAASVTLDTIIANALEPYIECATDDDAYVCRQAAVAVTDALLAKGVVGVPHGWYTNSEKLTSCRTCGQIADTASRFCAGRPVSS